METEALLRKLLRENRGIGVGEIHMQLACREFLIEHMDVLAEEGVKFLYTELFVHPDHVEGYGGQNYVDTQKQLRICDFKSAMCTQYPAMEYQKVKDTSIKWMEKRDEIPDDELEELDRMYLAFIEHPYSATKLYECAKAHGIEVVGANTSGSTRFATMLNEAKHFFENHEDRGKIVVHCGSRHLKSGASKAEGICNALAIPALGVFDGPQETPQIIEGGYVHWNIPNEKLIPCDYVVQGNQTRVSDFCVHCPPDFNAVLDVVLPDGETRINSYSRVPGFAEKILSGQQEPYAGR